MTNACYTSVQLKFCCETSIDIGFEMTFMDDITTLCHLIWWEGKRETLNEHLNEHFITDWTSAFFWVSLKIALEMLCFCVLGLFWFWKDSKNIALACFGFVPKMQRVACRVWWLGCDRCFRHVMSYMIISIYILYIICLNATHVYKIEIIWNHFVGNSESCWPGMPTCLFYDHWTF